MENKKDRKNQILVLVMAVLIIALSILIVMNFVGHVKKRQYAIIDNNLEVMANNCVYNLKLVFDGYESALRTTSTMLLLAEDLKSANFYDELNDVAKRNNADYIIVDYPNGDSYSTSGAKTEHKINYEAHSKNGEIFISNVIGDDGDVNSVSLCMVVNKVGKPFAHVSLVVSTKTLSKLMDTKLFDPESYYHVIDVNGKYVAASESNNALLMKESFWSAVDKLNYEKGFSAQKLRDDFSNKNSGYSQYSSNGNKRYAHYMPVGINEWTLMMIIPNDLIMAGENETVFLAIYMAIQICVVILAVFGYFIYQQRKNQRDSVLHDKCFRVLAALAGKTIFEWDFKNKVVLSATNFRTSFGRSADTKSDPNDALSTGAVHPDDADIYREAFRVISGGSNLKCAIYRVKNKDGDYHWCRLSGAVVRDQKKRPYRAICTLEDINESVLNEAILKNKSEHDQLTGLYNKVTTENMIKERLDKSDTELKALMIIDIDNFKMVNDNYGHQYGDKLLVKISENISTLFSEKDIVGRIGGDEFFVFLDGCKNKQEISDKAASICELFSKISEEISISYNTTASIGIALSPQHATGFYDLYKYADVALYASKKNGKNCFTIYDNSIDIRMDFPQA